MFVLVFIKNPYAVQIIYSHFSVGVDDFLIFQHDSHMDNSSFFILKKRQIADFSLFDKIQNISRLSLLVCITRQLNAINFINNLGKTTAIYPKKTSPAPQIGNI